jgi:RNA polymerase-binding transcription factor DksA
MAKKAQKGKPAKKAVKPAKKVVAKKVVKPVKKAVAKKLAPKKVVKPVKKVVAKKPAPKKVVKPAKKVIAKKVIAKKPAPKKVIAKKVVKKIVKKVVKKVVAKKVAPKKVAKPAKKVVAKKPVAKVVVKPVAKKVVVASVQKLKVQPIVKKVEARQVIAEKSVAAAKSAAPIAKKPIALPKKKYDFDADTDNSRDEPPMVVEYKMPSIHRPMGPTPKPHINTDTRTRYSDAELKEFKELILKKLAEAQKDFELLKSTLSHKDDHGTDDTSPTFKLLEDGSDVLSKEETAHLAGRQEKFIQNLQNALIRIENKTYGICRVTGKLISKERLKSVPHATFAMEAKLDQNA